MNPSSEDEQWMQIAILEAERGIGKTAPNPPVGAVIVRNQGLIGSGWHRSAGQPHAEREAIADAISRHGRDSLRGSTLYVTLEPCSTDGRTPPCTLGIIEAGIQRVVYACKDENPRHDGRADACLSAAGIEVTSGVLASRARRQLEPFFKVCRTGLPWVIWKSAMSIDGRLTRHPAESRWITSDASRHDVQQLRSRVDAILTSGATVRADRPSLNIRDPGLLVGRSQPLRVVFSGNPQSLPRDAPIFRLPGRNILCPREGLADSLAALVRSEGVLCALLEAGGTLCSSFFAENLVDEVVVYLAPILTGGDVPALADPGITPFLNLEDVDFHRIVGTSDIRLRGRVKRG